MFRALVCVLVFVPAISFATVQSMTVEYSDGKTTYEGFMAFDDAVKTPRPAVIIVHQWMGVTDHERTHAQKLAELGYVAFALDVYGKGVRPKGPTQAGSVSSPFRDNRKLFRERELAAYNFIKKDKRVNPEQIVVIGYCFGGTGALELARSGSPLAGVVSFHGGLSNPNPEDAKKIKAPVLVLHGAIDPFVKPSEVQTFMKEMDDAGKDYQLIAYSGAVHGFTQRDAGNDPKKGVAYNETAYRRSWQAFTTFLTEVAPVK